MDQVKFVEDSFKKITGSIFEYLDPYNHQYYKYLH